MPWAGAVTLTIDSASPFGSVSFAVAAIVVGWSSPVVAESFTATGAPFTTTVTVAVSLPPKVSPPA